MSGALIDLGEVPRTRPAAAVIDTGPPIPTRVVLGLLAAVLVASLAGAVARVPPPGPVIIPARLGDATFVDGDRLHVVSTGRAVAGSRALSRTISTYDLPAARLVGRATVDVSGGVTGVWEAAGSLVVAYQVDTSGDRGIAALAAGTDRVLWRRIARLIGVSPADGLVLVETGDADLGIDVATGRTRWSVPHPADGFTAGAGGGTDGGYPRWLVTVTDSGRLETRDSRTGALLGTARLSRRPGRAASLIWPVGDLVMVDTFGAGFDAYRLPRLDPLWRTPVDLAQSWMQAGCGALICTFRRQWGMTVLDPATGREMWASNRWTYAEPAGRYLLATPGDRDRGAPPLWVLDPATGRSLGNFGRWQGLGPAGDGRRYGVLGERGGSRIHYGVLDPATREVRVLGAADRVSTGCETAGAVLICRLVDASVGVWALR